MEFKTGLEKLYPYLSRETQENIKVLSVLEAKDIIRKRKLSEYQINFLSAFQDCVTEFNYAQIHKKKIMLSNQRSVLDYFKSLTVEVGKESVHCLFLDAKNRVIDSMLISEGTITQSLMYPRMIIIEALSRNAASIIVMHNHPSGDPRPSESDRKITERLAAACKTMDIQLLDHLIIGEEGKGYFSFYEEGLMTA